jgi:hypothetical protein
MLVVHNALGLQPMIEFYLRSTANRTKEMFSGTKAAIKEMFD